jgi:hypothetical protein
LQPAHGQLLPIPEHHVCPAWLKDALHGVPDTALIAGSDGLGRLGRSDDLQPAPLQRRRVAGMVKVGMGEQEMD